MSMRDSFTGLRDRFQKEKKDRCYQIQNDGTPRECDLRSTGIEQLATKAEITLNRKSLNDVAAMYPEVFTEVVGEVKTALAK
ncbi:hypothetical protein [Lacunimicrobium album]